MQKASERRQFFEQHLNLLRCVCITQIDNYIAAYSMRQLKRADFMCANLQVAQQ